MYAEIRKKGFHLNELFRRLCTRSEFFCVFVIEHYVYNYVNLLIEVEQGKLNEGINTGFFVSKLHMKTWGRFAGCIMASVNIKKLSIN